MFVTNKKSTVCLLVLVFISMVLVAGCTEGELSDLPVEQSGDYIYETSDDYGFRVRRPSSWVAEDLNGMRDYIPDVEGFDRSDDVRFSIVNYEANQEAYDEGTFDVFYSLYQQNPSLTGWTEAVKASWETDGAKVDELTRMPNARIYLVTLNENWTQVIGLVEANGHPMSISISTDDVSLDELYEYGLMDELEGMITSLEYYD